MAEKKEKCGCFEGKVSAFERNNYFCGKLMVERDFWDEQHYHMGKRMLHNANLHGWGTLCCLKVDPHPVCPNLRIIVRSGMAIDCYGRVILVPRDEQRDLESYRKDGNSSTSKPENLYICLSYKECKTEPVTAFLDDCGCKEVCESNRIREEYEIEVLTVDSFAAGALPLNLYSVIVSGKKVISGPGKVDITKGWEQFDSGKIDGSITIRTSKKSFTLTGIETIDTVDKLMLEINNTTNNKTKVKISYDDITDTFMLACSDPSEVVILEQTGTNPFFTEIKMTAYHSEHKKVIRPCPACPDNTRIVLAVIEKYNTVTDQHTNPENVEFKTAAYTINNFVHRMTVPDIGFMERVIHYLIKKGL